MTISAERAAPPVDDDRRDGRPLEPPCRVRRSGSPLATRRRGPGLPGGLYGIQSWHSRSACSRGSSSSYAVPAHCSHSARRHPKPARDNSPPSSNGHQETSPRNRATHDAVLPARPPAVLYGAAPPGPEAATRACSPLRRTARPGSMREGTDRVHKSLAAVPPEAPERRSSHAVFAQQLHRGRHDRDLPVMAVELLLAIPPAMTVASSWQLSASYGRTPNG